ncbi:MAG: sigma-70 family RNA polymerase sigma factor [Phycisphaera sp. RhM]|nr:sigma-70 family RNA polymerase sigma factor [Phycisphaera sp. RhM]
MAIDPPFDDLQTESALRRVCRGETAAFEAVVRRFERPLRAWLAAHAPPGVDVDDLAQRSFVAAFTRLKEYQPGTDFAAWLFTIARFQLRTETTRLRRIADYHARYGPDLLQRELDRRCDETPEMWTTRLESLQMCLDSLGESLRQFVSWRYDEEIPLEEMAARCDRSVPAVKKQLWKVRQKLQQCIETRMATASGGAAQ